ECTVFNVRMCSDVPRYLQGYYLGTCVSRIDNDLSQHKYAHSFFFLLKINTLKSQTRGKYFCAVTGRTFACISSNCLLVHIDQARSYRMPIVLLFYISASMLAQAHT